MQTPFLAHKIPPPPQEECPTSTHGPMFLQTTPTLSSRACKGLKHIQQRLFSHNHTLCTCLINGKSSSTTPNNNTVLHWLFLCIRLSSPCLYPSRLLPHILLIEGLQTHTFSLENPLPISNSTTYKFTYYHDCFHKQPHNGN